MGGLEGAVIQALHADRALGRIRPVRLPGSIVPVGHFCAQMPQALQLSPTWRLTRANLLIKPRPLPSGQI